MQTQRNIQTTNDDHKSSKKLEKQELLKRLTPLQYRVTQHKITERPNTGEYLKLNAKGKYCCVVCGEELFSSECKYDSGCGWPAFYDVMNNKKVKLKTDVSHVGSNLLLLALRSDVSRTEVTCGSCSSHLGHLFADGPKPTGKRFCINSAALKFHPSDTTHNASVNNKFDKLSDSNIIDSNNAKNYMNGTNGNVAANYCNKPNATCNAKANMNMTTKKVLMETHL